MRDEVPSIMHRLAVTWRNVTKSRAPHWRDTTGEYRMSERSCVDVPDRRPE